MVVKLHPFGESHELAFSDPLEIKGAVDRLIDACRDFLTWEIEVRRVVPPDNLRSLTKVFDGIAASVLGNIKP